MVFGAHEHAYERNYPVYNSQWNSSRTGPGAYIDYDRPIHILTGAAGCPENQDGWQPVGNPFSVVRINDYGACVPLASWLRPSIHNQCLLSSQSVHTS